MTDEDELSGPLSPSPAPPSWLATVLRQKLSTLQAIVGVMAGALTISGAVFSVGVSTPASAQGEVVALVQDARSRQAVAEATVEILTAQDALVTTLTVEGNGRITRRLKEGQYRLRVSHPDFATETRQVEVHAGQRSDIRLALVPRPPARVVRTVSEHSEPTGAVRKFLRDLGF